MKTNDADRHSPFFRTGIIVACLIIAVALSGCAAAIVGAGAAGASVAYKMGQMEATLPANLPAVVAATNDALTHLQLAVISRKQDAFGAAFTARTAMDSKVQVRLISMADNATQVKIRVGVFGDEPMSLKIYEQIRSELPK